MRGVQGFANSNGQISLALPSAQNSLQASAKLELTRSQSELCIPWTRFTFMPRYHDGVEVFDSVGVTLPDNEAARRRALELATI
jgi:hypothetical protein